jgi:hypothetical protein
LYRQGLGFLFLTIAETQCQAALNVLAVRHEMVELVKGLCSLPLVCDAAMYLLDQLPCDAPWPLLDLQGSLLAVRV